MYTVSITHLRVHSIFYLPISLFHAMPCSWAWATCSPIPCSISPAPSRRTTEKR